MDHPEAFTIWTVREHLAHGYTASMACGQCCHNLEGPLDLQAFIDRGLGDKPLRQTGIRCPRCRQPVLFSVHPPSRHRTVVVNRLGHGFSYCNARCGPPGGAAR